MLLPDPRDPNEYRWWRTLVVLGAVILFLWFFTYFVPSTANAWECDYDPSHPDPYHLCHNNNDDGRDSTPTNGHAGDSDSGAGDSDEPSQPADTPPTGGGVRIPDCVHDGTCACWGVAHWAIESGANPCKEKEEAFKRDKVLEQIISVIEQIDELRERIRETKQPVDVFCETKGGLPC